MNHNIFREYLCKNIANAQTVSKRILLLAMMAIPILLSGCRVIVHKEKTTYSLTMQTPETKEDQKDSSNVLELPDNEIESYEDNNGKYGYKLKTTGEIMIPAKYDHSWPFREGLAHVRLNGKFGFVDKSGNEVIPLKYDLADFFSEGLTIVELDEKYGFIDKTGEVVIPFIYDGGFSFKDGLAVVELDGKFGYIDKTGKEVIPLKYDWAWSFSDGKAEVKLNGEKFYIDRNGNRVE